MDIKKVGYLIRDTRIAKGMTQLQLASKLRISISTISGLETGSKKSVSTTYLELIGKELGIKFEI